MIEKEIVMCARRRTFKGKGWYGGTSYWVRVENYTTLMGICVCVCLCECMTGPKIAHSMCMGSVVVVVVVVLGPNPDEPNANACEVKSRNQPKSASGQNECG